MELLGWEHMICPCGEGTAERLDTGSRIGDQWQCAMLRCVKAGRVQLNELRRRIAEQGYGTRW
jgi:hypothetical protein